jgi:DNA-directed RNA polymerase specialized sigma24 family protein
MSERDELILTHLGVLGGRNLVEAVYYRCVRQVTRLACQEDTIAAGSLALVGTVDKYLARAPATRPAFTTFAWRRLQVAMVRAAFRQAASVNLPMPRWGRHRLTSKEVWEVAAAFRNECGVDPAWYVQDDTPPGCDFTDRELLRTRLNLLPPLQSHLLWQVYAEDVAIRTVAAVVGMSVANVRYHLRSGMLTLRRLYREGE